MAPSGMLRAMLVVAVLCAPAIAHAETDRYGGELVGTEAAGWTVAAIGARFTIRPVVAVGIGVVVLGPPAIHLLAHDEADRALVSLGMRVTFPLAGGLLGALIDPCRGDSCVPAGIVFGAVAGYLTALVIDAVVLAKDTLPDAMPMPRVMTFRMAF